MVDVRTAGRGIGRPTNMHKKSLQKLMLVSLVLKLMQIKCVVELWCLVSEGYGEQ